MLYIKPQFRKIDKIGKEKYIELERENVNNALMMVVTNKLESEKLKSKAERLISSSRNKIRIAENNLVSLEKSILKGMLQFVRTQEQELQSKSITLNQLDPKSIFKRGYTRSEVEGVPVHLAKLKVLPRVPIEK